MFEAHYRGDASALVEWTQKAIDRINKTSGSSPQAFFVAIAVSQTRYLGTLLLSPIPAWVLLLP